MLLEDGAWLEEVGFQGWNLAGFFLFIYLFQRVYSYLQSLCLSLAFCALSASWSPRGKQLSSPSAVMFYLGRPCTETLKPWTINLFFDLYLSTTESWPVHSLCHTIHLLRLSMGWWHHRRRTRTRGSDRARRSRRSSALSMLLGGCQNQTVLFLKYIKVALKDSNTDTWAAFLSPGKIHKPKLRLFIKKVPLILCIFYLKRLKRLN